MLQSNANRTPFDRRLNIPFVRTPPSERTTPGRILAYDIETTRIPEPRLYERDPATPIPLYFTLWGEEGLLLSEPLWSYEDLGYLLLAEVFVPRFNRCRFVAWNANRFDLRVIMNALIEITDAFTVHPFIARNAGLRGAKIQENGTSHTWHLYDGIAMTGLAHTTLEKFVETYAPHVPKLKGAIDFEREEFDNENPTHIAYAERDSEALYHAMVKVEELALRFCGMPLRATVGKLGILYFRSRLPSDVEIWRLSSDADRFVRRWAFRGGYVYTAKAYRGPAFAYDLNQAYAASMRDTLLPHGSIMEASKCRSDRPGIFVGVLSRSPRAPHPFLVKPYAPDIQGVDVGAVHSFGDSIRTVLCTNEIFCARKHGWSFVEEWGYEWRGSFRMVNMVAELESLRFSDALGPSGPIGTFAKAIGNNAYGKTVEQLVDVKYAFTNAALDAKETKTGRLMRNIDSPWRLEFPNEEALHNFWIAFLAPNEIQHKDYHRPQLGTFITAGVRCTLYDAIMTDPDAFLKADTDSVCFSRPNPHLRIDPRRYGEWKLEHEGDEHIIIGKKVYAVRVGDKVKIVCKGLSTRNLTWADFEAWFATRVPPKQEQVQLQSWRHGIGKNVPMYKKRTRTGTQT